MRRFRHPHGRIVPSLGHRYEITRTGSLVSGWVSGFFLLALALVFMSKATAQPWFNPGVGGTGDPPLPSTTWSTNRLDLDRDGSVDFEIRLQQVVSYEGSFSGWTQRNSSVYSLVPQGGCRILALDQGDVPGGDLPVLAQGDKIGTATPGRHWSDLAHVLVNRVEPIYLNGPLGGVWFGTPGYNYLGVSLGSPEAPVYGWLCFSRDRGINPLYWGYARHPSTEISAGDLSTSPSLTLKVTTQSALQPGVQITTIGWEPEFAEATLEEFAASSGTWNAVNNPLNPGYYVPGYTTTTDDTSPAGQVRLFRVRFGP